MKRLLHNSAFRASKYLASFIAKEQKYLGQKMFRMLRIDLFIYLISRNFNLSKFYNAI